MRRIATAKNWRAVTRFNAKSAILLVAALLWLPAGIALSGVIRGFSLPADPEIWISLIPAAPAGLPLAIACRLIHRQNMPGLAWANFVILAPVSAFVALFAGLLGPIGIILGAVVVSLPAFGSFGFAYWKTKRSASHKRSGQMR